MTISAPIKMNGLKQLAAACDGILCDVWGVLHNGVRAHVEAAEALVKFRGGGGRVVLVTNAPRRKSQIVSQLDGFGVDRDSYDDIVTSGDAAREILAGRPGTRVRHVGVQPHRRIFEDLPIELVGDDADAEIICCTGLDHEDRETPDDYDNRLRAWSDAGVPMLCANPDIVVEHGDRLVWCAGALARRYGEMGGQATIVGKPHAPVYATALRRLDEAAGRTVDRRRILAIGDGSETDMRGANEQGFDALFITSGIHAAECGDRAAPDPAAVASVLAGVGASATGFMPNLIWES